MKLFNSKWWKFDFKWRRWASMYFQFRTFSRHFFNCYVGSHKITVFKCKCSNAQHIKRQISQLSFQGFKGFCLNHFVYEHIYTVWPARNEYNTLDTNLCVLINVVCVFTQVWWRSRRESWRRSSWTCRVKQWPESHLPGSHTFSRWLSSASEK